jgi:heterodisulfide reductase subunit A
MYQTVYQSKSTAWSPVLLKPAALIIGGGLVGMTIARQLAQDGMQVVIAEKRETLGGGVRNLHFFYDRQSDVQKWLQEMIAAVESTEGITVHTSAQLKRFDGYLGRFQASIGASDGAETSVTPSVVVLATGCINRPPDITESKERLIGFSEMETLLAGSPDGSVTWKGRPVKMVVYLLDRTNDDIKIHTVNAIKQSIILQEKGCRVAVCAKDLKVSVAGMERLYRQAREKGVLFFKYDEPPVFSGTGEQLSIEIQDLTVLKKDDRTTVQIPFDLGVVSETFTVDPETEALCRLLRIRPGANGMLTDDNPQLQRVLSNRRGIFVAGACRFPQVITESLSEAHAVVQEVKALLHGGAYTPANPIAEVDPRKCAVCYSCVRLCPHAAIGVERYGEQNVYAPPLSEADNTLWGAARIEPGACFGCGICVAECPAKAITLYQ